MGGRLTAHAPSERMAGMQHDTESTTPEQAEPEARRPWQTPDLEELDCAETASGVPPVTGPGDGINAYS